MLIPYFGLVALDLFITIWSAVMKWTSSFRLPVQYISTMSSSTSNNPKSDHIVALEPPLGTSFYKRYTERQTHEHNMYRANITVDFYVYVANCPANDPQFTEKGGRVYVITRINGQARAIGDNPLTGLKYGLYIDTSGSNGGHDLLYHVKSLPDREYTQPREGEYQYSWNLKHPMNLFKSNGNESQPFTATVTEDAIRRGWKQHQETGEDHNLFKCDQEGKSPDTTLDLFGVSLWEATRLGKLTFSVITSGYTYGASSGNSLPYVLDFSESAMTK